MVEGAVVKPEVVFIIREPLAANEDGFGRQ